MERTPLGRRGPVANHHLADRARPDVSRSCVVVPMTPGERNRTNVYAVFETVDYEVRDLPLGMGDEGAQG